MSQRLLRNLSPPLKAAAFRRRSVTAAIACAALLALLAAERGGAQPSLSKGQTLYVPIYSEVLVGDRQGTVLVRATVTVRNTDPRHALSVISADYHDLKGKLVRSFVDDPVAVGPLATIRFAIPEIDTVGGISPSMIIRWSSEKAINQPIAESLMITTFGHQGISFLSRGQVLDTD